MVSFTDSVSIPSTAGHPARAQDPRRGPREPQQLELTVNPRLAAASSCLPNDPANIWLLTMAACCAHSCTTAGPHRETSVRSSSQRLCSVDCSIRIPPSSSRRSPPSKGSSIAESRPISAMSINASAARGKALQIGCHLQDHVRHQMSSYDVCASLLVFVQFKPRVGPCATVRDWS